MSRHPCVWHIPPSGHRIASRAAPAPYCACKCPSPPLPALFAAVLTPTTCTGWCVVVRRYTRTFFLALPPPPPLLPAGFAFLSSFLGGILRSHRASRQRSVPSTRREALMCASSGSDLRPGKAGQRDASTLVRQGQSAQALRQRVAQVPGGETGAACGCGSVSAVRASPKPGNVRAGPPSRPAGVEGRGYSPSHAPGRSSLCRGEKSAARLKSINA